MQGKEGSAKLLGDDYETERTLRKEDESAGSPQNVDIRGRKRSHRRSFSALEDWKSLPPVCQGSLLFYASDNFYFNKWIQADFLSVLLVHGGTGDSEDTIMLKALIMTSGELASAMHEVKLRAAKVLIESIRRFLKNRRERQQRELRTIAEIETALSRRPFKPWRAIQMPDPINIFPSRPKRVFTGKEMWRTAANRIIFAERMSGATPKQKFRASPLVDAAASGNAKLLEEFLARRSAISKGGNGPHMLSRGPSRQAKGSFKRLSLPGEPSLLMGLMKTDSSNNLAAMEKTALEESLILLMQEDLNAQDITRKTPLQAAVEHKRWECMMLLLNEPEINISIPDQQTGDSVVHTMLGSKGFGKLIDLLRTLLSPRFKFDVNMKNRQGSTVLAIAAGQTYVLEDEVHSPTSTIQPSHRGSSSVASPSQPQSLSSKGNSDGIEVMKLILARKGDVNALDNSGRYPIEHAAAAGIMEYVTMLAQHENTTQDSINRALFAAIPREGKANMDIVQYLICDKGANVQQDTGKLDNVLIVASRNNQLDCVRTLLNWPFISRDLLKARNADCFTALHAAVHENNNQIALMLVKHIFGHSVLDERSELGLLHAKKSGKRNVDGPGLQQSSSEQPPGYNPRSRANNRHMQGRRGALIVATSSTDSEVVDAFLFSVAAQANNVEMIEHLLFEGKGFKDTPILVTDRMYGKLSTNLICWSVRQRNKRLMNLLLNFGADINAIEVEGSGLFPLMIAVKNLAAPPWSRLAMDVLQVGKDTPCITMQDMVNITKRSKWEICHIADTLQDSKGNPLKSPTGRQLFSRNSWKFSWYGFQAVASEVSGDLKARVENYTNELDVSLLIYETIINSPLVNIHQEVSGQTPAALAVECGNWRVFEDLRKHGASICHPSVIQACAVNACVPRLMESLNEELSTPTLTEEYLTKIFDLTCEAGHVECAQLLFEHSKKQNLYLSVQEQLLKAATDKQHWMIDFLLSKDRSYATKGRALVICAENGDFRSLEKLLAHGADPDFYSEVPLDSITEDTKTTLVSPRHPISIAGEYWGRSGSRDHYEVIVALLRASPDVTQQDSAGKSILMWACLRGHVTLAETVLSTFNSSNPTQEAKQKYLDLQDCDGRTAIMHAVVSSCDPCVNLLLDEDACVDTRSHPGSDGSPSLTVLGYLTSRCRENAPDYLLRMVKKSKTLHVRDENQSTFMAWAARFGHTKAAEIALELNSPSDLGIHSYQEGEHSALELACMCKRREICWMLIKTWDSQRPVPDSIRTGGFVGISLFERFIEYGWEDVTLCLIERFCPLDVKSQVVVDALQSCVENGWLGCIQGLIRRGVSPNSFSSSGHSPLVVASQLNQIETVKCLLENKASGLEAAAIVAIHLNHLDCFQILFKSIFHTFDFIRATACIASLENNVHALKLILAEQCCESKIHALGQKLSVLVAKWIPLRNLNKLEPSLYQAVISDNLSVPLLCAVATGSLGCTCYLLETKADPMAMDENGLTAMVWACAVGNLEIVKALVKHGASITAQDDEQIMPFYEMKIVYNIQVIDKIEGRMKKLLRRTLQSPAAAQYDKMEISVPPLLAALLKGHTDVVRLLIEAGASTGKIVEWCNETLQDEPKMEMFLRSVLEMLVLYEDYKAYGPFGIQGNSINCSDLGKIPDDGRVYAVVAQFSKLDWSLIAIQFIHQVRTELVECEIHATNQPKAGNFRCLHPHAHIERLDLEEHEYIIEAELAIANTHIHSLRFTTNLRVTKWLGETPIAPRHRVVTIAPVGREIVGMFSCVLDRYYLMGFLTRLRMGDFPWRWYRTKGLDKNHDPSYL